MRSSKIKKNLLDLEYNKHLQRSNTYLIIIFTYLLGIMVAFITKQIDYKDLNQVLVMMLFSMMFFGFGIYLILRSEHEMQKIIKQIKTLNI